MVWQLGKTFLMLKMVRAVKASPLEEEPPFYAESSPFFPSRPCSTPTLPEDEAYGGQFTNTEPMAQPQTKKRPQLPFSSAWSTPSDHTRDYRIQSEQGEENQSHLHASQTTGFTRCHIHQQTQLNQSRGRVSRTLLCWVQPVAV